MVSAQTVSLPPEGLVVANGAQSVDVDFETRLRMIYCLMTPQFLRLILHLMLKIYVRICKTDFCITVIFIRTLSAGTAGKQSLSPCPVSDIGSRDTGSWFAMEYTDQMATRAWAFIVKLEDVNDDVYHFIPRGLDISRKYKVTLDNYQKTVELDGWI